MISILIPTLNRSDFLIRALHYYSKIGFKGYICIGDSSDTQHVEETKRAICRLQNKLNIIYRVLPKSPKMTADMCIHKLIELAPTPYAVFSGDDDFLIPNGLKQCAGFLENHPEYSAAHGLRANISLENEGAFGKIISGYIIAGYELESEAACERWIGYIRNGISTQYYIHRTETWRRMYRDVSSVLIPYVPEILTCSLTTILGKVKRLDCLSTVFHKNDHNISNWDQHSLFSLINHPNWHTSIKVMRDNVVETLVQQDGIDKDKANKIFERELWLHLTRILAHQYNVRYDETKILKKPPNALFSTLLKPTFPYYSDFRQVYLAITAPAALEDMDVKIS